MSILQVAKVWEYEFSHAQQSIMLALADFAHDDGTGIWPCIDRVAWKTGYSRRQVQRIQKDLKESGVLVVTRESTHDMPAVLAINWAAATKKAPFTSKSRGDKCDIQGVTNATPRGDILSQGVTNEALRGDKTGSLGVTPMSPDPSLDPSYNRHFLEGQKRGFSLSENLESQESATPPPGQVQNPAQRQIVDSSAAPQQQKSKFHEYHQGLTPYQGSRQFMEERPWITDWKGNLTVYPEGFLKLVRQKISGWSQFQENPATINDAKNCVKAANYETPKSKQALDRAYGWWDEYQQRDEVANAQPRYVVVESKFERMIRERMSGGSAA